MLVSLARIDCANIEDWDSFHDEFNRVFAFPDFYGRNMDAWIDCMTSIDAPDDGMSGIHCEKDGFLTIELENVNELRGNRIEYFEAVVDCVAFVNWRRIETGDKPVLALSYYRTTE
ncbi:MAG: barstar family protein [Pseudomonadota bacterium]